MLNRPGEPAVACEARIDEESLDPSWDEVSPDNVVDFEIPVLGKSAPDGPLHSNRKRSLVIKNEKPIHRTAAWLYAAGHGVSEIAVALGVTQPTVSIWLQQPWFRDLVLHFHSGSGIKEGLQSRFAKVADQAFQQIALLATTARSEQTRLRACEGIIDRVLGKAPVMVKSDTLSESLDPLEESKRIDQELKHSIEQLQKNGFVVDVESSNIQPLQKAS